MYPECCHYLIEEQARKNPNKTALVLSDKELTYGELNARANQLARYLLEKNVKPDMPVAIYLERGFEQFISILAILKIGAHYVPFDVKIPAERALWILKDASCHFILTQAHLVENLADYRGEKIRLDVERDNFELFSTENIDYPVKGDSLAYIIYTSGTTGFPKGVCIEHNNIMAFIEAQEGLYKLDHTSRVLQFSAISFDVSVFEWVMTLTRGATLCLLPSIKEKTVMEVLIEILPYYNITFAILSHTVAAVLSPELVPTLETLILGIDMGMQQNITTWLPHVKLINMYGPTETTIAVTAFPYVKDSIAAIIGYPTKGNEIYILDSDMQPVSLDEVGEIFIGGRGLARGYVNNPTLTKKKFIDNPVKQGGIIYKTGDLAKYLPDGSIEYIGRSDQQIKRGSYRIELNEISSQLQKMKWIKSATVIYDESEKKIIAVIILMEAYNASDHLLIEHKTHEVLSTFLPQYMLPSAYFFIQQLPFNINGKLDLEQLLSIFKHTLLPTHFPEETKKHSRTERKILKIFRELLGHRQVCLDDNIQSLGLDSILVLQLITKAQKEYIFIEPKILTKAITLKELADTTQKLQNKIREQYDVIKCQELFALTPIQSWFFSRNFENLNHWNQAVMIEVNDVSLNIESLEEALEELCKIHDSLRLQFSHTGETWQQSYSSYERQSKLLSVIEVADKRDMRNHQNAVHTELDIQTGNLIRAILFYPKEGHKFYFYIAIHHLAIDGVSWRILVEDLAQLYKEKVKKKNSKLIATSSYSTWVEKLHHYIQQYDIYSEIPFWEKTLSKSLDEDCFSYKQQLFCDSSMQTLSLQLSAQNTWDLLYEINKNQEVKVVDVLLAALCRLLFIENKQTSCTVMLMRYGREKEIIVPQDFARTTGWFTNMFPFKLHFTDIEPIHLVTDIQRQFHAIPGHGIGYGLLRYFLPVDERIKALRCMPEPVLSLNYMGQWNANVDPQLKWQVQGLDNQGYFDQRNTNPFALEINAVVIHGHLKINWAYNSSCYSSEMIHNLSRHYLNHLYTIIDNYKNIKK